MSSLENKKTFVVLGANFSGTSMVAGTLRKFGICMGENFNGSGNHEDVEFQFQGIDIVSKLIDRRNERYDIWGWKDPNTINIIDDLIFSEKLVNPHFIIVFRDLLAISMHTMKHHGGDIAKEITVNNAINTRLSSFVFRYGRYFPIHLVSYEKAKENKEDFVKSLSEFCDVGVSDGLMGDVLEWIGKYPYNYKNF